ncbi:MAG: type II toxin-antitoxin system VapC family toxin [Lentisphaerae bacterium]|nr:type II toxin-antitoxin system VapC family toxin [Lentisphaerota bacterium]
MMILDTCALLWLVEGAAMLNTESRARIEAAPVVYVSAITGFEIGLKHRSGKLRLPTAPLEWLQAVLDHHVLTSLPLDLETCVAATQLPPIHGDPCDRLIIAAALRLRLPVVTADQRFKEYGVEVVG